MGVVKKHCKTAQIGPDPDAATHCLRLAYVAQSPRGCFTYTPDLVPRTLSTWSVSVLTPITAADGPAQSSNQLISFSCHIAAGLTGRRIAAARGAAVRQAPLTRLPSVRTGRAALSVFMESRSAT